MSQILGTSCKDCRNARWTIDSQTGCKFQRLSLYEAAGKRKEQYSEGLCYSEIEAICPYYSHTNEDLTDEEIIERAKIPVSYLVIDRGNQDDLAMTLQSIVDSDISDTTSVYVTCLNGHRMELIREKLEGKVKYLVSVKMDLPDEDSVILNHICHKIKNSFICVVEAGQSVYEYSCGSITAMINDGLQQKAIYYFDGYYGCLANIAKAMDFFSFVDLKEKLEYADSKPKGELFAKTDECVQDVST